MNSSSHPAGSPEPSNADVARWLARRDRGLTGAEQDEYLQWLREDPRRARAVADLEAVWRRLDTLSDWRPTHAEQPNPDLLAPPPALWRRLIKPTMWSMAAAAAIVAGVLSFRFSVRSPGTDMVAAHSAVKVLPAPERIALSDGSVVELNSGGRIQPAFTVAERRVRLIEGEAAFTVAKNPARPFVVETPGVAVRAVGTVFDVHRRSGSVDVLVTEGKVRLERSAVPGRAADVTPLAAGQRAVIDLDRPERPPVITSVAPLATNALLAWRSLRLEFSDLPLSEVVAEFNLRNHRQIVVADAATGELKLRGTFQADNIDGFVRLLEASLPVRAETQPDGTVVLQRSP